MQVASLTLSSPLLPPLPPQGMGALAEALALASHLQAPPPYPIFFTLIFLTPPPPICPQGLGALAEALALASHLQALLLWGNNFGPASSKAFLETLGAGGACAGGSGGGGGLAVDFRPYEADGRAQVALLEVAY